MLELETNMSHKQYINKKKNKLLISVYLKSRNNNRDKNERNLKPKKNVYYKRNFSMIRKNLMLLNNNSEKNKNNIVKKQSKIFNYVNSEEIKKRI